MLRQAASDLPPPPPNPFVVLACSLALRKQVLVTKGLDFSDFASTEEAYKAADVLIAKFQERFPDKVALHPDQSPAPDMPQLDSFWYAEYKGAWAL
jgi:hypothetical protein